MTKPTVGFYTLGCKVNSFDTEAMAELFAGAGYQVVPFEERADVYVVNTCTVTHLGDRKSRNMLRRARRANPGAVIVAAGCYAQVAPEEVSAIEEVDLIIGTQDRHRIVDAVAEYQQNHRKCSYVRDNRDDRVFEELAISQEMGHTRAFLKVQEGCDRFCSYCIVPYARGRVRSRPLDAVTAEVERLVAAGFLEVVLTGIHIASYGIERDDGTNLLTLIQAVAAVPGLKRIRLGSLEPRIMTEEFTSALARIPGFCPHFHLSLQSGSDTVLKRMNRRYTTAEYAEIVARIRRYFDHPAITTDVMVGFPGETDAEFDQTLAFVQAIGFYQIHIFRYSRRKGTVAADMQDQVRETVKAARSHRLSAAAGEMEQAFLQSCEGLVMPVLFEQAGEAGGVLGHTPNYIPVEIAGDATFYGKIRDVRLSYIKECKYMGGSPS